MSTASPSFAPSDVAILARVIEHSSKALSVEAARAVLGWDFSEGDRLRMDELAEKARHGELTTGEQSEIDSFDRVGQVLAILQSKARATLRC